MSISLTKLKTFTQPSSLLSISFPRRSNTYEKVSIGSPTSSLLNLANYHNNAKTCLLLFDCRILSIRRRKKPREIWPNFSHYRCDLSYFRSSTASLFLPLNVDRTFLQISATKWERIAIISLYVRGGTSIAYTHLTSHSSSECLFEFVLSTLTIVHTNCTWTHPLGRLSASATLLLW